MSFSFTGWLKTLTEKSLGMWRKRPRSAARTIRSTRLGVESLEHRLVPSATIEPLANFTASTGVSPRGSLVRDSSGDLFGTTAAAGASGDGSVFEVAAGSGAVTVLATFNGANGSYPQANLVRDSSGNLFGTTWEGGASNDGTVFELAAGSHTITTLASFTGANGANPAGGLVEDSSGNLFGTTFNGGVWNAGSVFEVAASSRAITTLFSFIGFNGANPNGSLVEDSSGNLFGTTEAGGASGDGTVFELVPGYGRPQTLVSFTGANGADPEANLVEDSNGNLFGTTTSGGATGYGTVFEVASGSNPLTTLASLNSTTGKTVGGLVEDSSGDLFGTTVSGNPANYDGTVFEVAPGSGTATILASFNYSNGAQPRAGLIQDSNGILYGTASTGGLGNEGTVFQVAGVYPPKLTAATTALPADATQIILHGSNFDPVAANNTVTFNDGAAGTVTAASPTSLTVTLSTKPTKVGTLTAIVTTDGVSTGAAVQVATVTPVVTRTTYNLALISPQITIHGYGFDPIAANNTVTFNDGAVGKVTAATATSLTVVFLTKPKSTGILTAIVDTDGILSGAAVEVANLPTVQPH